MVITKIGVTGVMVMLIIVLCYIGLKQQKEYE